jgi:hypothetical protein
MRCLGMVEESVWVDKRFVRAALTLESFGCCIVWWLTSGGATK